MHSRTVYLCNRFGVGQSELPALDFECIGPAIPEGGATLVGGVGCGKTWRMAQHAASLIEAKVVKMERPHDALMPSGFLRWVNWPEESEELKRKIAHGWMDDAADRIEDLRDCRYLFVDDLGQERIKRDDDWSLGAIKEILDHRYRANLPTFITSNLGIDKLSLVYGSRIVSRMLDAWPIIDFGNNNLRNRVKS